MVSVEFFIAELHHCALHSCLGHERTEECLTKADLSGPAAADLPPRDISLIPLPSLLRAAPVSPKEQMVKLQQLLLLRSLHPICGFKYVFSLSCVRCSLQCLDRGQISPCS